MLHLLLMLVQSPSDTVRRVHFSADLGLVVTSGNTDITTLNLADKLGIALGKWSVTQQFSLTYGRTDDTVSASLWQASVRGDRTLSRRVGLFLLTDYDRNRFAGFLSRVAPSFGVTGILTDRPTDSLRAELGGGYTWQRSTLADSARNFASGRIAATYTHHFHGKALASQAIEFLPNFHESRDLRINSETTITAPITNGIAMKASYVVHYEGVPEPGFRKTDRILTSGVQITF